MKYFHLNGIINEELFDKFITFYNETTEDYKVVINSRGGKSALADIIRNMIEESPVKVTLISAGCFSSAFELFYKCSGDKIICEGTTGMYHMPYIKDVSLGINNRPSWEEDICNVSNFDISTVDFIKEFITTKELKKFHKNEDVFFTFKRMKEIFPDAKILK